MQFSLSQNYLRTAGAHLTRTSEKLDFHLYSVHSAHNEPTLFLTEVPCRCCDSSFRTSAENLGGNEVNIELLDPQCVNLASEDSDYAAQAV